MIEILKAIILGIVEGITEWLPISSTGHMILVEEFIQLDTTAAFKEMFFVVMFLTTGPQNQVAYVIASIVRLCALYLLKKWQPKAMTI